jgi:hypothetical protein
MSDDMEAAIAAGSTMVRIGTPFLVRATTANNKESEERHEDVDFPAFNGH